MDAPAPVNSHQVAALFGVSQRTVLRWIEKGLLEGVRGRRGWYSIPVASIRQLAERRGIPLPQGLKRPSSVLIVDPLLGTRQKAERLFGRPRSELRVWSVADAFDAGRVLAQSAPRVVVFDPLTPGLSSEDICGFVRSDEHGFPTALVAMLDTQLRRRTTGLLEGGCDMVVPKPMRPSDVSAIIEQWL